MNKVQKYSDLACIRSVTCQNAAMGIRHRRPRAGERTRGAVDALQTKIAVSVQNLDPVTFKDQLAAAVAELPDA
ncbi:MAG: hypothetical protein WBN09_12555, partial [Woeseiaceae bacterium]